VKYITETASGGICISTFLKIGTGVHAILFCFRISRWCNVGISEGRDL
jgi:hypothetical protein